VGVLEALKARGGLLVRLFLKERRRGPLIPEILERTRRAGREPSFLPASSFPELSGLNHQGISAVFRKQRSPSLDELLESLPADGDSLILALDHLQDPGNLGALLRSAHAFGADAVVSSGDRSASLSPGAVKASQGAAERVPFLRAKNLNSALKTLKSRGYWVAGARQDGALPLPAFKFPRRTILVLGSESRGLSRLTEELCDFLVSIPMAAGDSLNVAAAGAILLYAYRNAPA
jgi:23S rRNA (guanosine2251-2'-O)-methyltransferase